MKINPKMPDNDWQNENFGKNYTIIRLECTYKVARTCNYGVNNNEEMKQKVIFMKKAKFSAGFESFVEGRRRALDVICLFVKKKIPIAVAL